MKEKHIIALAALALFVIYMMYLSIQTASLQDTARQNNTYLRTEACILSVPLAQRTREYIKNCYDKAEKANNTKVDRFGDN